MLVLAGCLGILTVYNAPPVQSQTQFRRVPLQYIAALGDPQASSGDGAQQWGIWRIDPGPRGVPLSGYSGLLSRGGRAPAGWEFQGDDWWLEEHGLLMEPPRFPLPPGEYVVTGGREATAVLTVYSPDENGDQRWQISGGARLKDVTHIPCRAARFRPAAGQVCSPGAVPQDVFPLAPDDPMPGADGCRKQNYHVLFVIGVAADS